MSMLLRRNEGNCPQWHAPKKWPEVGLEFEFMEWDSWEHKQGTITVLSEDRRHPPRGFLSSGGVFHLWDAVRMWRYFK